MIILIDKSILLITMLITLICFLFVRKENIVKILFKKKIYAKQQKLCWKCYLGKNKELTKIIIKTKKVRNKKRKERRGVPKDSSTNQEGQIWEIINKKKSTLLSRTTFIIAIFFHTTLANIHNETNSTNYDQVEHT